jgi:Asp-tRNA(Asn)/Glu-tRNA(Gln) amidotransferase A subunit family amidase
MADSTWTLRGLRTALANGTATPSSIAEQALARSNQNLSHNTYLWQDAAWTRAEAARVATTSSELRGPFWGLPISVKDCFELANSPTSAGTFYYRDTLDLPSRDSWLVEHLRSAGAVITGKTHLHPLAYGITGENPDFADCLQPCDPTALTGGSSSGAAASIQEGSAVFAIGTDTGGSIRAPAALCGLAGYRASIGRGDWRGGAHLAPSFDTFGGLFRDLEDAPLLASLFPAKAASPAGAPFTRFAVVHDAFLHDCDPSISRCLYDCVRELESVGLQSSTIDVSWWSESYDIFAPIQASEAAHLHAGHFPHFDPSIRQRLEWGASIAESQLAALRQRHQVFRNRLESLFAEYQLILMPATPVTRLIAGADHSEVRPRILRYTTPFSLGGQPVVTIPCVVGGMQLAAALHHDESLLHLAAQLGRQRNAATSRA